MKHPLALVAIVFVFLRSAEALVPPSALTTPHLAVISRAEWGAVAGDDAKLKTRLMGKVRFITIHHTESPTPDPIDEISRLQSIQRGHLVTDHAWGDIAYHYLIGPSGRVYEGRSPAFAAASGTVYLKPEERLASGQNALGQTTAPIPVDSAGNKVIPPGASEGHLTICLIGDFSKRLPTPEAQQAMAVLVATQLRLHSLKIAEVLFHREVACWSDCPGQILYDWFRGRNRKVGSRGEGLRLIEEKLVAVP